jgi:5-hydroxyisourate hydrolase
MSGKLTTHVLDTANGCPAVGIAIALWELDTEIDSKTLLKTTEKDGQLRAYVL